MTKGRDVLASGSIQAHFDIFGHGIPYRSTDNLADDIKLHLISGSVNHHKLLSNGHLDVLALPRQRMPLSPALLQYLFDVIRVETHVH